ncbi:hypothetical protein HJFPF1_04636 [Paramyrothecium foliicola]|nr:hypothetical protein HJFPF1_04636 [Paramyrothecium foliicola]
MQSWSNAGQNGADDHGSWQQNYDFTGQNGQFEDDQNWSQPIDQSAYSHLSNADPASTNFFEAPQQQNAFLAGDLHGGPSNQAGYHGGHDSMSLAQQFSQSGQPGSEPSFHNIHPDLYAPQGKLNITDGLGHTGRVQTHPHGHSQAFTQHEFSFAPQNEQTYTPPVSQYSQPQLVPQPSRQQSHTPVQQQFHNEFVTGHGFARPAQSSPVQQSSQQQPPPQQTQQPTYAQHQSFPQQLNGHPTQYEPNSHLAYQQHQQPQQPYNQAVFAPPKPHVYQQPTQPTSNQQLPPQFSQQQTSLSPAPSRPQSTTPIQYTSIQQPAQAEPIPVNPPQAEPTPKKRKRATKAAEPVAEPVAPLADSPAPIDLSQKKPDEIDSFEVPVPSASEAQSINQFAKRNKTAQAKYPSINGLPHLIYEGSIKLPAPKSYDKLAPLIALPPRSSKRVVPELGYDLPCEVQGRFTSQYRPSVNKIGLDERREEAKVLLDEYDRSMSALGKRRPKYTEYPHAFKEQLKSDEASKNKAEKKAKKELEDERNKPIRAPTRPSDLVEAAAWDAIGIVHVEESTPRTNSLIAGRVQQAGDFFIKLRGDMTRAKTDLDQAIKDKKSDAEVAKLKQDAEQKKEALYRALDATIEHADDGVLDNLGGHQKLILSMVNVLIGCIKASDFSGKLPKIVLELFTNFRMTKKIAETTNFDTVRKRFADKGDDEVKELVRELSQKIRKVLKAAEAESGYSGTSAASRAKASTKPAAEGTAIKRGREEEPEARTVKKVAMESGGGSLSKKLAQPKAQSHPASKIIGAKPPISTLLPGKTRPIAKTGMKTDDPARNSPTPPIDDKAKDAKTTSIKSEPNQTAMSKVEALAAAARSAPSASALSGIASLLDSINAPKAEPLVKASKETKDVDSLETPEQKAKRLRKEARRKLRVSWKPEEELVQVKIFQKDDEEDEGREINMIRDAADDRSEGMVLKQRAIVDEDDEDDDIPYQPWLDPVAIDFSNLPEAVRSKNYVTRGGKVTFTTDEQRRIAEREQRELMAIYTDPSDIPATPKSPPPESSGAQQGRIGYLPQEDPKYQEIQLRWRDEQQLGVDGALYAATKRLDAKEGPSGKLDSILGRLKGAPTSSSAGHQSAAGAHIPYTSQTIYRNVPLLVGAASEEQVLAWFNSEQLRNWHEPEPMHVDLSRPYQYRDAATDVAGKAVEIFARSVAGKPFPATSPPEWLMKDQERVREWWLGYDKENLARQKKLEEERARAEAEANALRAAAAPAVAPLAQGNAQDWSAYYAQHPSYAPYMAMLQQQSAQPPAATAGAQGGIGDSQINSILAAINQPGSQSQASNPAGYLNPNDPSYQQLSLLMQMTKGQQSTEPQADTSYGGDRSWDRNDDYSRGDQYKDGRKKKATLPPHKPANKALIGTKPCTFWQQGKCARGDKCTFRHD